MHLPKSEIANKYAIESVKVSGSGIHSQAEAARHGITKSISERRLTLRKRSVKN